MIFFEDLEIVWIYTEKNHLPVSPYRCYGLYGKNDETAPSYEVLDDIYYDPESGLWLRKNGDESRPFYAPLFWAKYKVPFGPLECMNHKKESSL